MERILKDKLKEGKFHDVPASHSKRMSAIKGRGNKTTELKLRLALVRSGLKGWTVNPKGLIGNPDFYFPEKRLAVFVDGCFWHGCSRCGHIPKKNNPYWSTKILRNQQRDIEKTLKLQEAGIKVLRFWEHQIKEELQECVGQVSKAMATL
jgi:DNA mismatch endonuclease, patch repair protein